jgi:hypothetical protein
MFYLLDLVEHATNGWGARVGYFDLVAGATATAHR